MRPAIETIPLEAYARGVDSRSLGARLVPSLKYMFSTEVHTYAFSIAANVLLSFIPFAVLMLSFSRDVLHWQAGQDAIRMLLRDAIPNFRPDQTPTASLYSDFVVTTVGDVSRMRGARLFSLVMLAFTSTGVLLPLEVALNRIWGIKQNRSFLANQLVSYGLVLCSSFFAMLTVALTAINLGVINSTAGRMGWTGIAHGLTWVTIKLTTLPAIILIFFVIYHYLPNGKVPRRPVMLAAVFAGVVTEIAKHIFAWLLPWLNFYEVYGNGFSRSVTIVLQSYVAAMVMLVGAYFAAYGVVREPAAAVPGPTPSAPQPSADSSTHSASLP